MEDARIGDLFCDYASTITARYHKGIGAHKDNMVMSIDGCKLYGTLSGGEYDSWIDYMKRVYDINGCAPTQATASGGHMQTKIAETKSAAIRGRMYRGEEPIIEIRDELANSITSVQKDSMVYEEEDVRIRRLTPRECIRLMNFTDDDYDRMKEVNSETQIYKQAGNSIVVNCITAILGQIIPGKEDEYKKEAVF